MTMSKLAVIAGAAAAQAGPPCDRGTPVQPDAQAPGRQRNQPHRLWPWVANAGRAVPRSPRPASRLAALGALGALRHRDRRGESDALGPVATQSRGRDDADCLVVTASDHRCPDAVRGITVVLDEDDSLAAQPQLLARAEWFVLHRRHLRNATSTYGSRSGELLVSGALTARAGPTVTADRAQLRVAAAGRDAPRQG